MLKDYIVAMAKLAQLQTVYLNDEDALRVQILFQDWNDKSAYKTGDRVKKSGTLYKCLQDHQAQADWNPESAPSLWAKVLTDPSGAVLPWEQPDSTNPYQKGDTVTHNGYTWISDTDNNVWEPGVYGWTKTDGQ